MCSFIEPGGPDSSTTLPLVIPPPNNLSKHAIDVGYCVDEFTIEAAVCVDTDSLLIWVADNTACDIGRGMCASVVAAVSMCRTYHQRETYL